MLDTLTDLIGPHLADDLSRGQREEVERALAENPDGVRRVAAKTLADYQRGDITNPAGILISRLRRGQHLRTARLERAATGSLEQRVETAYHARLTRYPELGQRDALEYAIDHYAPGRSDIEHAIATRLHIPTTAAQTDEPNPLSPRWQRVVHSLMAAPRTHPARELVHASQPHLDSWTPAEHIAYLEALEELL